MPCFVLKWTAVSGSREKHPLIIALLKESALRDDRLVSRGLGFRVGMGSIPKFGDWLRTGLTERDFGQSDGYQLEKANRNVKRGRTYEIRENDVRQTSAWRWMHG
jgi:hypothetical protein